MSAGAKWDRQWSQWRYRPQSNSQDTSPLLQQTRQAREKQVIVLYIYTVHILPWKTIHIYIYTYIYILSYWYCIELCENAPSALGSFDWVPSKATEHRTQARNQQKSKTRVYLVVQNRFLHEQHPKGSDSHSFHQHVRGSKILMKPKEISRETPKSIKSQMFKHHKVPKQEELGRTASCQGALNRSNGQSLHPGSTWMSCECLSNSIRHKNMKM